jgi:hypothetical protein
VIAVEQKAAETNFKIGIIKDLRKQELITEAQMKKALQLLCRIEKTTVTNRHERSIT